MGSIPPGPNIKNNIIIFNKLKKNKNNKFPDKKIIQYSLTFTSLFSPFILNKFTFNDLYKLNNNDRDKKILIKQSYMLLTWLYYLSFINIKKNKNNKITIFVAPVKLKKFTTTKAPMAHKTRSKEQYKFLYYNFKISFKTYLEIEKKYYSNNSIYTNFVFLFLTKKEFFNFETNLLFLKFFTVFINFNDFKYFNFYKFIK